MVSCIRNLPLLSSLSHDALWSLWPAPSLDWCSCGPARRTWPSAWGFETSFSGMMATSGRSWGWWPPFGRSQHHGNQWKRLVFYHLQPRGRWMSGRGCNRYCPLTLTHWEKMPASSQLWKLKMRAGVSSSSDLGGLRPAPPLWLVDGRGVPLWLRPSPLDFYLLLVDNHQNPIRWENAAWSVWVSPAWVLSSLPALACEPQRPRGRLCSGPPPGGASPWDTAYLSSPSPTAAATLNLNPRPPDESTTDHLLESPLLSTSSLATPPQGADGSCSTEKETNITLSYILMSCIKWHL